MKSIKLHWQTTIWCQENEQYQQEAHRTRPCSVGCWTRTSLLRKATPCLFFLNVHIFQDFIISLLVCSGSTQSHRTLLFHFSGFSLLATNSPIYVSGLCWMPDLFLQLPVGCFSLYVSYIPYIYQDPILQALCNFTFWIPAARPMMHRITQYLVQVTESCPRPLPVHFPIVFWAHSECLSPVICSYAATFSPAFLKDHPTLLCITQSMATVIFHLLQLHACFGLC